MLDLFRVCSKSSASHLFQILLYLLMILFFFSFFRTNIWFDNVNLILWSYKLKHILIYQIILLYFVIIKTLETSYKTHFSSSQSFLILFVRSISFLVLFIFVFILFYLRWSIVVSHFICTNKYFIWRLLNSIASTRRRHILISTNNEQNSIENKCIWNV